MRTASKPRFRSRAEIRVALTLALPRYRGASLDQRAARAKITPAEYVEIASGSAARDFARRYQDVEMMLDRQRVYDATVRRAVTERGFRDREIFYRLVGGFYDRERPALIEHRHSGEVSHVHSADDSLGAALRDARRRDKPKMIDAEGREIAADPLHIDFDSMKNGESAP